MSSLALVALLFAPAVARAAVSAGTSVVFPPQVTVGQAGIGASITLANFNTPPQNGDPNIVCNAGDPNPCVGQQGGIVLTPSCNQLSGGGTGACTPAGADPGVFRISPTAAGRAGTACAGFVFVTSVVDAAIGTVRFTPQPASAHVLLPVATSSCTIDFTVSVLKSPAGDLSPAIPGIQTAQTTEHVQCSGNQCSRAFASTGTTVLPAPAPPLFPAKLEVLRARVLSASRRLDVLAPITSRASGDVRVSFRAAGRTTRFEASVDSANARVRIDRRIPSAQARLGTGILTLAYPGDADTQPQEVRLRAAPVHADLRAGRPTLDGDRLRASGRISSRARGIVRLQVLFEPAGQNTRTLQFSARIAGGRYSLNEKLPADVVAQIATRRGVVHSYTLFTGYLAARMRGEMASFQVAGQR